MERFVDGWNIVQTLGEGAFGEVKLLINEKTNDAVALKIVDLQRAGDAKDCVYKEERIHRMLHHPHIIKLLGKREESNVAYLFLEFASGGELFDKIEPDVGMHSGEAQKYMTQLLDGLEYLHRRGITHRDIKPENLLLDEENNLKISDFGMATIFRLKGRERQLDKRCGTLPYVAPEVLKGPYFAQPSDIWSCGIVFVAMLTGELPWNEPTTESPEFARWVKSTCITESLWKKLSTMAFSLARKILNPEPAKRLKLPEILGHTWMKVEFTLNDVTDNVEQQCKRIALPRDTENKKEIPLLPSSQPTARVPYVDISSLTAVLTSNKNQISFSQPTQNDDLLLNSQISFTQSQLTQNQFKRLVKRMTRFTAKISQESTVLRVCKALDYFEYPWSIDPASIITVSTVDSGKLQLVFKISTIDMDDHVLVDFRLSKGCGIEFKRRFVKIKNSLTDIICRV
ncbi:serine/threonine-protein kinase grp isoform X2 [Atheta coriaria]|uniref:serine/threonine-protein kinase grp isoform X2 n=1 Tax=Dalotia coriaria TaxID=877792 RepID=UPI0031F40B28